MNRFIKICSILRIAVKPLWRYDATDKPSMGQMQYKKYCWNGALKPKPEVMPFGMMGVLFAVVPGLFIGAAISKSVANFLEENDLFVPSDDDED